MYSVFVFDSIIELFIRDVPMAASELVPNSIAIEDSSKTSENSPVFKIYSLYL